MKRIVYDPRHPRKEWYEELCALAAIGELSSSEFEDLQQHLAQCSECRAAYFEFRRISADDLGALAILRRSEQAVADVDVTIDQDESLRRLLSRAAHTEISAPVRTMQAPAVVRRPAILPRLILWLQRPALSYGAVLCLLCAAATIGGFRLRGAQLTPTLRELSVQVNDWKDRTRAAEAEQKSVAELLERARAERASAQKLLAEAQARYLELENQRKRDQAQSAAYAAQLAEREKEVQAAQKDAIEKDKKLAELESGLRQADQHGQEQEATIARLRNKLWEEVSQRAASQNVNNAEAKELFGARDLHIVDVYDVESNGQTRRTYGRVYYVSKKLLIFYAFDLQDKKHNRAAVAFQAWGYRQPNENTPQNLGLFTLDDGVENCWVLKVNNPRVLERIDAVFVTLENPNGSPSPRGRRILYANLAGPANHP